MRTVFVNCIVRQSRVSINRQSRGLCFESRSKRLEQHFMLSGSVSLSQSRSRSDSISPPVCRLCATPAFDCDPGSDPDHFPP
jgi:hypothetical protein